MSPAAVKAYEDGAPPLWSDLGSLSYPISTNAEAQRYFDQGLRLAANFNHAEARRALEGPEPRSELRPLLPWRGAGAWAQHQCANGSRGKRPRRSRRKRAQALAAGATDKEKALIAAVAKRYSDDPAAERPQLDAAFADAMAALSDKYPEDLLFAVMAAEAAMDTQPWDYWQPGGKEPKGRAADIQKRLEGVLAKDPKNAWAIHLYIHLVEASDRPERAEPYADQLAALMPGAGHIVHMPSHIYYRIGRYTDSLAANEAASRSMRTTSPRRARSASIRSATTPTTSTSCWFRRSCSATPRRLWPRPRSLTSG